ncbi:hypothetical protein Tco_1147818 [Tanacetum coccineum]
MAENPIPFTRAKQIGFNLEDVTLNTNNKVALLYLEHSNKEVFLCVSDFISKCCIRKAFARSSIQYKEYLFEFWYSTKALDNSKVSFLIPSSGTYGVLRVNTFRKAIGSHYLSHSSNYVDLLSIDIMRPWFLTIRYGEEVSSKGTLKKSLLPPRKKVVPYTRFLSPLMMQKMKDGYGDGDVTIHPTQVFSVNNWALKPSHTEGPPFTAHMMVIYNVEKPVDFKAPRTSSQTEMKVSQGTKLRAKTRHKKQSTFSKQPPMSTSEATKGGSSKAPTSSKTGPSRKRKESSSAKDSNLSQPLVSTLVDTGMHKEDQQAAGGPTSLGVTTSIIIHSESASGYDALADSTTEVDPETSVPNDYLPP